MHQEEKSHSSFGALLVGMVAGIAVATYFLGNKKRREKLERKMNEWKAKGKHTMQEIQGKVEEKKGEAREALDRAKEKGKEYEEEFDNE